ncbi:MAG: DMT family transporter [candidate division Zixibacteria bacterium]
MDAKKLAIVFRRHSIYLRGMADYRKISLPIFTSLTFAGSFIAGKYAIYELPPLTITLIRYIIAFLFLSLFIFKYKTTSLKVSARDHILMAILGLTGVIGYHFFFYIALRYTAIANTAIINAFGPVVIGIAAAVFLKERLRLSNYIGILISLAGVMLLITKGHLSILTGMDFNRGDLLMFCAVLSWTVYALITKKLIQRYSGFAITFYSAMWGVIILLPLSLFENAYQQVLTLSATAIYSILYMGIVASAIGYLLYNLSIEQIGPTRTSSFVYSLVPIFVSFLALVFFDEPITLVTISSTVLIILGLRFMLKEKT